MFRAIICLFILLPAVASAQVTATLVADQIHVTSDNQLIAKGNVEALYNGTRLSAARITYDQSSDRLIISGPLFLTDANGDIVTADRASLDPKLENGILRGARIVLDQQLQLAAHRIDRQNGRLSRLSYTTVTSCAVCGSHAPLWDIRATQVIHDQDERQLYFENATLRVRGMPIFWLPYMRLPDPTLSRATGFLIPRLRNTNQLGNGIAFPYFITLGKHRDLTLTPYLSSETRTLEARYRQAFLSGDISINGAISEDTIHDGTRSYLFANGRFRFADEYQLSFGLQTTSDAGYLRDYSYNGSDRLESHITLTRVREESLFQSQITYFESLRENEIDTALPPIVGRVSYDKITPISDESQLKYGVSADIAIRTNTTTAASERDVGRVGAYASFQHRHVFHNGIETTFDAGITGNGFAINDDPIYEPILSTAVPHLGLTFRWPHSRQGKSGHRDLLTPTLAFAWSKTLGDTPPNEDSTRSALDTGNLFDVSRYPGDDQTESGLRAAIGLDWTRHWADGTQTNFQIGRVLRQDDALGFTQSSGLQGQHSDWLITGQLIMNDALQITGRVLLDDDLDFTLATGRMNWAWDGFSLSNAYIWQAADSAENRDIDVSEWRFGMTTQVNDAWRVTLDGRYDLATREPDRAGLGINWQNECVNVDFSLSRRFTSSTNVNASTNYGLGISLTGFSSGRTSSQAHTRCAP